MKARHELTEITPSSAKSRHRILIIVPEQGAMLEVAGITDIFHRSNSFIRADSTIPRYEFRIATTNQDRVIHGKSGLTILADLYLGDVDPYQSFDTIMVTGGVHLETLSPIEPIAAWLKAAAPHAGRICSVCTGAFYLAAAGLLDGKHATTHWRWTAELEKRFPKILVDPDPIFLQDGNILTSAGVTAGLDLALAMVEADVGKTVALQVAQTLVLYLRRPGTQSQFSTALKRQIAEPGPIRDIQMWAMEHIDQDLRVERLAQEAAMSPRNFARVFLKEVGVTPARYVDELRIEIARQRLEQGKETVERIAYECGFGTAATMRRLFDRYVRVSPTEYRARFRSAHAGAIV